MPTLISTISKRIRQVYQKAEGFIEEEREFPISQVFLNATFQRFVTNNVDLLKDLHADLHDDWLRLYATIDVKGLYTIVSVDLKLVQMELNKDMQLIVFEQISQTQVVEASFKKVWMKMGFNLALFFYQKVLKKDPLGMLLERFNVLTVKDELLHLDLNRWLGKQKSIMDTLAKVHINHAVLREAEMVVIGNVNLTALFRKFSTEESLEHWDEDENSEELLAESQVSPIKQKDE